MPRSGPESRGRLHVERPAAPPSREHASGRRAGSEASASAGRNRARQSARRSVSAGCRRRNRPALAAAPSAFDLQQQQPEIHRTQHHAQRRRARRGAGTPAPPADGTATPSPLTIAVLMPITRPSALASGPPELPGASRTSARIQFCAPHAGQRADGVHHARGKRAGESQRIADRDHEFARAQRRRIARRRRFEPGASPSASACAAWRDRGARSREATRARKRRPSQSSISASGARATWALVRMSPPAFQTMPEPRGLRSAR